LLVVQKQVAFLSTCWRAAKVCGAGLNSAAR
jgi:hypothetical protein